MNLKEGLFHKDSFKHTRSSLRVALVDYSGYDKREPSPFLTKSRTREFCARVNKGEHFAFIFYKPLQDPEHINSEDTCTAVVNLPGHTYIPLQLFEQAAKIKPKPTREEYENWWKRKYGHQFVGIFIPETCSQEDLSITIQKCHDTLNKIPRQLLFKL